MARTSTNKNAAVPAEEIPASEMNENANENEVTPEPEKAGDGEEKVTLTKEELNALIADALAKQAASAQPAAPQVIQVLPEEKVTLLFIGAVAKGSEISLEGMGKINGDGGTIDIPKRTFMQGVTGSVDLMLRNRKLIVLDGLDESERERYGVNYTKDELMSANIYRKLLDYKTDEIAEIYRKLCDEHKQIVATVFNSAVEAGDRRVTLEKLRALIDVDRENSDSSYFTPIFKKMNDRFTA